MIFKLKIVKIMNPILIIVYNVILDTIYKKINVQNIVIKILSTVNIVKIITVKNVMKDILSKMVNVFIFAKILKIVNIVTI